MIITSSLIDGQISVKEELCGFLRDNPWPVWLFHYFRQFMSCDQIGFLSMTQSVPII